MARFLCTYSLVSTYCQTSIFFEEQYISRVFVATPLRTTANEAHGSGGFSSICQKASWKIYGGEKGKEQEKEKITHEKTRKGALLLLCRTLHKASKALAVPTNDLPTHSQTQMPVSRLGLGTVYMKHRE